ncbi:Uncharacterised protein [Mycobacteroides abscessus subsp. abscessus]|nr:Uncharacterised protein [Mycobacteroides abscessus subsp. abscessus]
MDNGGRNRSTLPYVPAESTSTPLSWQYFKICVTASRFGESEPGTTSSAAIIAPRPRMSPIRPVSTEMARISRSSISPISAARLSRS